MMADEIWNRKLVDALSIPDMILFSRLADTIAWCNQLLKNPPLNVAMRSQELSPSLFNDGRDDMVCRLGSSRHWRIGATQRQRAATFPDLCGGRLMVYFPDGDLCDGAAEQETEGFFDVYNTPPWDTWVSYFDDNRPELHGYDRYLLAYVPRQFVLRVDNGILVNPEQCIRWLNDADVKLRTRLASCSQ